MSIESCGVGRAPARRLYFAPREVGEMLGISQPTVYRLIGRGELDAFKIGKKTVISVESIDRLIASLPRADVTDK